MIFQKKESAEKVVEHRDEHYINGKWVDCKSAILRQEMSSPSVTNFLIQKGSKTTDHSRHKGNSNHYYHEEEEQESEGDPAVR